jgi:two-component system, chemotaxis family, protein-glutamate methylesterase/glutaminase
VKLVVVGASWGGLYALMEVLGALPTDFAAPIVVVQHRSPDPDDDRLAKVLSRYSALPVVDAHDKQVLEPSRVYLAPADYHLMIEGDHIALSLEEPVNWSRPSIDVLFDSAAAAYGHDVTAVLLTGLGHDGAAGIAHVRAAGGKTIVQEPKSAMRPEMPQAGVDAGADEILPLEEIAGRLAA